MRAAPRPAKAAEGAETIAKIAESKSRGAGLLADGDLNGFLQIEVPK